MSALEDLKAADGRITAIAAAAGQTIHSLRDENAGLKAQVADLTAKLAAAADEAPVAAVAADLNTAADTLDATVHPPAAPAAEQPAA